MNDDEVCPPRTANGPASPRVVIHIAHASRHIPAEVRDSILLTDDELQHELRLMTDSHTDELFRVKSALARSVVYPVSRLVADPERFVDDELEPMAARGMGSVYTLTSSGKRLREDSPGLRKALIEKYYLPHHRRLTEAVRAALGHWESVLIIDCHSFSSVPLQHEPDQNPDRPDICLGGDPFHTPAGLIDLAAEIFEKAGLGTKVNSPFSGTIVPSAFYQQDRRVRSLMIEVSRGLYTDESTGAPLPSFPAFQDRFSTILSRLIAEAG